MREILFRGKRKDNGEWVEGYLSKDRDMSAKPATLQLAIEWEEKGILLRSFIIPETVGQYTGLTDKNGKKIFEGDILPIYENGEEYFYKVVYNGDCFMFAMIDSEQGSCPLSIKNQISEVVSNIHDNPELPEVEE